MKYLACGLLLLWSGRSAAAQAGGNDLSARLQRVLAAEDARGLGADGVGPLVAALSDRDALVRRVGSRGLGRLQRPELVPQLLPVLSDTVAAVRAEAANAVAQSVRHLRRAPAADSSRRFALSAERALLDALGRERNPDAADAITEAIGRLPFADSVAARTAERQIRERIGAQPAYGAVHAFYTLALAQRQTGQLAAETIRMLQDLAGDAADPAVRRLAVLTLGLSASLDSATTFDAARDTDEQVRRLALAGVPHLPPAVRSELLQHALRDASMIVRVGAVALSRAQGTAAECAPMVRATTDPHPYVLLMALDSLGGPCPADTIRAALVRTLKARRSGNDSHAWQAPAHALVALARLDSAAARPFVSRLAVATRWQERLYAARAAAVIRAVPILVRLAADSEDNVREAAIAGLAPIEKHASDSIYISALRSEGNQAVLMAAQVLGGSRDARTVPALLAALDRLSARRSENARDPRLMILRRLGELGGPGDTTRLKPYVTDFDSTVASNAAALLSKWSGRRVIPTPAPLPIDPEPLAAVFSDTGLRLRVTLTPASGAGAFVVRLFPAEAPATAARIIRLARAHYYDGAVIHRVEPNFVWQGGGPGASEYIGNSRFMRDELAWHSHFRGTLGISSRGRDTGDAQWFYNLADNPLLDHEYTVFGEVVSGREAAERIVEGDVISRIEVIGRRAR